MEHAFKLMGLSASASPLFSILSTMPAGWHATHVQQTFWSLESLKVEDKKPKVEDRNPNIADKHPKLFTPA